ncbi:hypothetical protein A6F58_06270 [Prescottella equi]|nr:hypothetical protein A6F58_06270 [Prescottella equi]
MDRLARQRPVFHSESDFQLALALVLAADVRQLRLERNCRSVGDFSEMPGPSFQFRDVNTMNDLHWVGSVPDTISGGTNLSITAKVDRYEERSCLFPLEPVTTAVR